MRGGTAVNYGHEPVKLLEAFKDWVDWMFSGDADWVRTHVKTTSEGQGLGSTIDTFEEMVCPPLTIGSFCMYAGIKNASWYTWKADDKYGLVDAIALIESVCKDDLLTGATIKAYDSNIVSRLLGLAENTVNTNTTSATVQITGMEVK